MNARDAIDRVLEPLAGEMGYALADELLDALAAAGFVVVRCAPGERIAVSREPKPCGCDAGTKLAYDADDEVVGVKPCPQCDGSGVVDTVTMHALERAGWSGGYDFPKGDLFRLVALPEDGGWLITTPEQLESMRPTAEERARYQPAVALPEETP